MNTADTSALVAAFATWHERHDDANRLLGRDAALIAHCAAECYSVLTRLPSPHRVAPRDAASWLSVRFVEPWLTLSAAGYAKLISQAPELGVTGGATFDAIVAGTAKEAGLDLVSFDVRARGSYRALGVRSLG
ncbi:MAG: PIN domain-containing protein [Acidimicrobiales bacterium]